MEFTPFLSTSCNLNGDMFLIKLQKSSNTAKNVDKVQKKINNKCRKRILKKLKRNCKNEK